MVLAQFQWWFLVMPLFCVVAIGVGLSHAWRIKREEGALHESISALSSYLQESIFVFLKRQLFLIGVTVALLIMGSVGLQFLNLHESSFLILIVWGVLWSAIIGYFAIRKSTQITGDFLQQGLENTSRWQENVTRMGWALTLIPLGILTFLLWVWMSVFQLLVFFNIFHTGEHLMQVSGLSGPWSVSVLKDPVFQQMHHAEMGIILVAFCFGPLIQSFLVRLTTQIMRYSTGAACKRLDYFYPGMGGDDLRNPVSMAHHIGDYAYHVWGHISRMLHTYLTVIISATLIAIEAVREGTMISHPHMVKMPFLLACFGLFGAAIASLFPRISWLKKMGISSLMMIGLSGVGGLIDVMSLRVVMVIVGSSALAWLMVYLTSQKESQMSTDPHDFRSLMTVWGVVSLILGCFWAMFALSHGDIHVVDGLYVIALGLVTFMGVSLPYTAFSQSHAFVHITINNARILQVDGALADNIQAQIRDIRRYAPVTLIYQTVLMTFSGLLFFFVFLDMLPYWLQTIQQAGISSYGAQTLLLVDTNPRSFENTVSLLGISPTNGAFLMGLFLAFWVVLGLGVFWTWISGRIEAQLFARADEQLRSTPAILEGQVLPSYVESVAAVTTHAYQSSFGLLIGICMGTIGAGMWLGLGGLLGLFLGMLMCMGIAGLYAFYRAQSQDHPESELAYSVTALATQAMLLFAILFLEIILYFGYGL